VKVLISLGDKSDDPVDVVILFVAIDKESHTECVRQVVKLFSKLEVC
jgi:mannitol/fructose-specific phosphotransferase system IIA component (Ntr-type)